MFISHFIILSKILEEKNHHLRGAENNLKEVSKLGPNFNSNSIQQGNSTQLKEEADFEEKGLSFNCSLAFL